MAKRTSHSKKSVRSLPKGLPVRAKHAKPTKNGASGSGSGSGGSNNPFETVASQRRPKFVVHNRSSVPHAKAPSALAAAVQHRQKAISAALKNQKKANVFFDQRIGEQQQSHRNNNNNNNNPVMAHDEKNMQRLVRERARHSKRASKFTLKNDGGDDDDGGGEVLTHRGKAIDTLTAGDHVILSDDDEADGCGDLNAFDTELHFGGHAQDQKEASIYGSKGTDLSLAYSQKKTDLDDLILRRKMLKQERLKSKEVQVDQFESMDDQFAELAGLLQFRDKEQDIRSHIQAKRAGALSTEDQEHADWDKEMKQYLYTDRKVAASDRTKTVEEIAKEEAEALHALETRRLARMNGDFDETDDLGTDSDDDEAKTPWKAKRFKAKSALSGKKNDHPEALDNDSDVEVGDEDQWTTHFTADGLVYIDKEGVVQGKVGDIDAEKKKDAIESIHTYSVGEKVTACYRATEQYDGNASWYNGVVTAVDSKDGQTVYYNIEYEDGDFEDGVDPCHMRPVEKTTEEIELETNQRDEELKLKRKRQKAKEKARSEIPFVFEVPTTLDALHDMIANYATTGKEVSLIIERIHKANSVRLDHRNMEKMQNFYDVLIRRFVAVGDAIFRSGDGGDELCRYNQLDSLTQTLYAMAQDNADMASAVWSRRLGFFHSAHAKRLRDAGLFVTEEDELTSWPSIGVILALRSIGHIFPVTDRQHAVISPAVVFLGQIVVQTPINSVLDLVAGLLCCGLLIEFTREAKRLAPEAHAFLASVIRLFAYQGDQYSGTFPLPTFSEAWHDPSLFTLRTKVSECKLGDESPQLSLESQQISAFETPAAILCAALHLVQVSANNLSGSVEFADKEVFAEITSSILCLQPKAKSSPLPSCIQAKVASVAATLSSCCKWDDAREALQRRSTGQPAAQRSAISSLAPRLENPDRYSVTQKDKGKTAIQAATDRSRREYKREHKAVSRELRLDGAALEQERRRVQDKSHEAAKAKRHKAFAWMEGEQATMNQQVRQGGGLLQGGGMGAAKAKARSGKYGIKKGGKLS